MSDDEQEKLDQTFVPVHPADETIDEQLKYMEEEKKGLAPSVEEVTFELLKLQVADLKTQQKIDLAIFLFKEASKEMKRKYGSQYE
tara:strand:- start:1900 stop:2157 length:258 start_codon:yes stop_codon:yes gene_type:complete